MCKKLIYLVYFVLVLALASNASADILVHWKLDDGSGTIVKDSSGNGNDGTFNGAPKWVAGKIGGALEFDGVDDFVVYSFGQAQTFTAFSVAFWVKASSLGQPNYASPFTGHYPNTAGFQIDVNGGNPGEYRVNPGGLIFGTVATDWIHLALTAEGTSAKLYYNGEWVLDGTLNDSILNQFAIGVNRNRDNWLSGIIDDFRVYDHALTQEEIEQAMIGIPPGSASNPSPANEATDVPRDVGLSWTPGEFAAPTNGHKVYFGESFNDVNDAVGGVAQSANSYAPPQRLDFNTTYYWRIDEVNAPPTSQIEFKGEVWQFTTEPIAYPIDGNNITATASSTHQADTGPENTINGSGLDVNDLHSTEATDMWLSSDEPNGAWIEYELDKVYKLHQMRVWNHNGMMEPLLGFGIKDVTIEYSTNGTDYTTLGTTHEFVRAPGTSDYERNTTVDFSGVTAKYIRLTTNSNWGGLLDQYGLSEVRFFSIPVYAREPSPDSGTTDVAVDVTLGFRAGREAVEHNVYLSSDEQAVIDGNAPVSTVTEASYGSLSLDLGTTYYWKINEVNEAETTTTWQGDIWNFTTPEYFVVDDFEDYNDWPPDEIWATWVDGYGVPTNGSTVGYPDPDWNQDDHYVETTIVHGGDQSMPFFYDNSTAAYSEATVNIADLPIGSNWTGNGVKSLSLWFSGDVNNVPEQMYVKLNGVKVLYDGDAGNITKLPWQPWNINVADFTGVDLSNVTELSIGFERGARGTGIVLFDDIRLYPFERQLITPVEPNSDGLMAYYEFEGAYNDSSGNVHHGTAVGIPTFVAGKVGQAISLGGEYDYVEIPDYNGVTGIQSRTIVAWIKTGTTGEILSWGQNVGGQKWIFRVQTSNGTDGAIRLEVNGGYIVGGSDLRDDRWHYVVAVFETDETPDVTDVRLYVDGVQETISAEQSQAIDTAIDGMVIIGKSAWGTRAFEGLIDDVRIYDYALSPAEVAWLAGVTVPFDKPF